MYKSKAGHNEKSEKLKKKVVVRSFLVSSLLILGVLDIPVVVVIYTLTHLIKPRMIYLLPVVLIVEFIICLYYFIEHMRDFKRICLNRKEMIIDFNEEGFKYKVDDYEINTNWDAIKDIRVTKEYFVINYSVFGIENLVFLFEDFEEDKDEIISELEKYKEIRR